MSIFVYNYEKLKMLTNTPSHFSDLPIYRKAMDIFLLSRRISSYMNTDLASLKEDGTEDDTIYFSGDIIQQSEALAPEIVKAELERYSAKKHRHIMSVKVLTNRLYKNCKRLEQSNSNGVDFLPILRKELNKFKKLQRTWTLNF